MSSKLSQMQSSIEPVSAAAASSNNSERYKMRKTGAAPCSAYSIGLHILKSVETPRTRYARYGLKQVTRCEEECDNREWHIRPHRTNSTERAINTITLYSAPSPHSLLSFLSRVTAPTTHEIDTSHIR